MGGWKRGSVLIVLGIILILLMIISINQGYTRLTLLDSLRILAGGGSHQENLVIFAFRLPRIIIAMLVGAGLALSGCIIQGISRNALADPGLLGINAGAGLMVVLFVLLAPVKTELSLFALPFLALTGAGVTAVLIYILAYKRREGLSPIRLILTGIAVQAGISAAMIVLTIVLDENQFYFVAVWLAGQIWGTSWQHVIVLLPWLLVLVPYVLYKARVLDVLNLGEAAAWGLGVAVEWERRVLLAVAVALAAACVAVSGGISFVGLIVPHLARRLVGPGHRLLLPCSALTGALLVVAADMLARTIVQPAEIPAGLMFAIVGAPYFLVLLAKSKR
ncbi:iron-dicitrate transporter subunit; membrane component of ABC superfamily; KpLE2 phage-like element [uncultured Sporomusa sp.]|uniref:Iron-dicitrate transporter subunit membrane component of ABC superfamily KpLE2 phage-like element n=1 Tax=uncultured Sporomusa sp. TaxID=307249 RepID=A0A212LYU7_9FIRM|nr:iron ABC transporter permease [uncultured Sporomusa sp.]SCM82712.1 iron-dicitrate transporter subunit; membrane component of ABC superfamily; KpLE2 phage-like element [uncultured Sporomusa sp.]